MIDPTLIAFTYQCVKCRMPIVDFPPAFEGYVSESMRHLDNDATRVEPVCTDCWEHHFARYETTDPHRPAP